MLNTLTNSKCMSINQFSILGRERRRVVRKIARRIYLDMPNSVACLRLQFAADTAESQLRREIKDRLSHEPAFRSILSSILLSIAIKLAMELIKHWLRSQFASPDAGGFQTGEPGA